MVGSPLGKTKGKVSSRGAPRQLSLSNLLLDMLALSGVAAMHPATFTFAGDAADPPITRVGAELKHTYASMLNMIPGNAKPAAAEFDLRVGSFNFQDPEGVLTRLAVLAGRPLNLSELTVVDIGGGGHTPPAMRPFLGVSRYVSFDASSSSVRYNRELGSASTAKRPPEVVTKVVTPHAMAHLLRRKNVPRSFALLKIGARVPLAPSPVAARTPRHPPSSMRDADIDSIDCEVLNATLSVHVPTVVVLEANPAFPPPIRFAMRWEPGVQTPTGSRSVLYGCAPPPPREQSFSAHIPPRLLSFPHHTAPPLRCLPRRLSLLCSRYRGGAWLRAAAGLHLSARLLHSSAYLCTPCTPCSPPPLQTYPALLQYAVEDALFVRAGHLPLFGELPREPREICARGSPKSHTPRPTPHAPRPTSHAPRE